MYGNWDKLVFGFWHNLDLQMFEFRHSTVIAHISRLKDENSLKKSPWIFIRLLDYSDCLKSKLVWISDTQTTYLVSKHFRFQTLSEMSEIWTPKSWTSDKFGFETFTVLSQKCYFWKIKIHKWLNFSLKTCLQNCYFSY